MVEYSSESSDDEEADMCVADWNWPSKSKPFVCSSLSRPLKVGKTKYAILLMSLNMVGFFYYLL
jgi:hypothetical protein